MSKKIHTIQSSDKKKFDEQVNLFLELGCELVEGSYHVINSDDGVIYSKIISHEKKLKIESYDNGILKSFHHMGEYVEEGLFSRYERICMCLPY